MSTNIDDRYWAFSRAVSHLLNLLFITGIGGGTYGFCLYNDLFNHNHYIDFSHKKITAPVEW